MKLTDVPVSQRWLAKRWFEEIGSSPRVSRGKRYAHEDSVDDLEFREGLISAKVYGTRVRPYTVTIEVEVLPSDYWLKVARDSRWNEPLLSRLQNGKFLEPIYQLFAWDTKWRHIELIPRSGEMQYSCNCPDWGYPCKHSAAVLFEAAAQAALQPALLFRLRGISFDTFAAEVSKWRLQRAVGYVMQQTSDESRPLAIYHLSEPVQDVALVPGKAVDPSQFWGDPLPILNQRTPAPAPQPALGRNLDTAADSNPHHQQLRPIDQLGTPPGISWSKIFDQTMSAWYRMIKDQADSIGLTRG